MNNETKQYILKLLQKHDLPVPKVPSDWYSYRPYHTAAEILDELCEALDIYEEGE